MNSDVSPLSEDELQALTVHVALGQPSSVEEWRGLVECGHNAGAVADLYAAATREAPWDIEQGLPTTKREAEYVTSILDGRGRASGQRDFAAWQKRRDIIDAQFKRGADMGPLLPDWYIRDLQRIHAEEEDPTTQC